VLDQARIDGILEATRGLPIVETLAMRFDEFDEGLCRMTMPYERRFDGVYESFHGGLLMTAADSAACFAIWTQTGAKEVLTTTDMNIRFLAPCLSDVTTVARVIKLGSTLCPVAVEQFDQKGTRVAVSQVSYIRLKRMPRRR